MRCSARIFLQLAFENVMSKHSTDSAPCLNLVPSSLNWFSGLRWCYSHPLSASLDLTCVKFFFFSWIVLLFFHAAGSWHNLVEISRPNAPIWLHFCKLIINSHHQIVKGDLPEDKPIQQLREILHTAILYIYKNKSFFYNALYRVTKTRSILDITISVIFLHNLS